MCIPVGRIFSLEVEQNQNLILPSLNVRLIDGVVWAEFGFTSKVQFATSKNYPNLRQRGPLYMLKGSAENTGTNVNLFMCWDVPTLVGSGRPQPPLSHF